MSVCTRCNGSGKESCGGCFGKQTTLPCTSCNGTGLIENANNEEVTCPRCHGHKRVQRSCPRCGNTIPCPECHGQGTV